ncbi:nucleoid occlusion protein, partial [Clostridium perfringens]|nr:nucleoid occlusion protein [Clostridium perfringens]
AEAYYNLINDHKFTQDELAKRMGKKHSTIANKLRLLKLSSEVRESCIKNKLTERHARALLSLPNEDLQLIVIEKVVKNSLNVKATEEAVNKELLKLAGEELNNKEKKKIKSVFPAKLYVNTIKQVFDKFNIPAEYKFKDEEEFIQITV